MNIHVKRLAAGCIAIIPTTCLAMWWPTVFFGVVFAVVGVAGLYVFGMLIVDWRE